MIAGWVFGKIFHSSCGLSILVLFLNDFVVLRKLTVSPQYSCLARMSATVAEHQLYGTVGGLLQFLPILFQYSVGVSTFVAFSRFAICVGPSPSTHRAKICLTVFAASSSIIHSFLTSGFFIYPKGGFVVSGTPDIPLFLKTLRTFWLVFLACHSLNRSCIGTRSLIPFAVSMLSIIAIYRTPKLSKSSSNNWPTTKRLRPRREWSFTISVPIIPFSASSIISVKAGLAKADVR